MSFPVVPGWQGRTSSALKCAFTLHDRVQDLPRPRRCARQGATCSSRHPSWLRKGPNWGQNVGADLAKLSETAVRSAANATWDPDEYEMQKDGELDVQQQSQDFRSHWQTASSAFLYLARMLGSAWLCSVALARVVGSNLWSWTTAAGCSVGGLCAAMMPESRVQACRNVLKELPEGVWPKLQWLWERPWFQRINITLNVASWGIKVPAILALVVTQFGILASQVPVSLPMLAPLLLGTGMLLNSISDNASFVIPRLGLLVVLLWAVWFVNYLLQNVWILLRKQSRINARLATMLVTVTECCSLVAASIVLLSSLGINVSGLLLPAGIGLAIACKDLVQNMLAGFFLFIVQPFSVGDAIAVGCSHGPPPSEARSNDGGGQEGGAVASASGGSWFEGTCERVDLRYVVLRNGRRRLMVPAGIFLTREFLVIDDVPVPTPGQQDSKHNASGMDEFDGYPAKYVAPASPAHAGGSGAQAGGAHAALSTTVAAAALPYPTTSHLPPLGWPVGHFQVPVFGTPAPGAAAGTPAATVVAASAAGVHPHGMLWHQGGSTGSSGPAGPSVPWPQIPVPPAPVLVQAPVDGAMATHMYVPAEGNTAQPVDGSGSSDMYAPRGGNGVHPGVTGHDAAGGRHMAQQRVSSNAQGSAVAESAPREQAHDTAVGPSHSVVPVQRRSVLASPAASSAVPGAQAPPDLERGQAVKGVGGGVAEGAAEATGSCPGMAGERQVVPAISTGMERPQAPPAYVLGGVNDIVPMHMNGGGNGNGAGVAKQLGVVDLGLGAGVAGSGAGAKP